MMLRQNPAAITRRALWQTAAWRAVPLGLLVLAFFTYWFAFADRYNIFLYYHDMGPLVPDTSPFSPTTGSRYWMAGLVTGGVVVVLDTAVSFLRGRLQLDYQPPPWLQTWLITAALLLVGLPAITMTANDPTLPLLHALRVTAVALLGMALALLPGQLAARRPDRLGWLALDGVGLTLFSQPIAALDELGRWMATGNMVWIIMVIALLGIGITWLLLMSGLRRWRRHAPEGVLPTLAAGAIIAYLLMPLVHHVLGTDGYFYITDAANFFADTLWMQLLGWAVVAAVTWSIVRLRNAIRNDA